MNSLLQLDGLPFNTDPNNNDDKIKDKYSLRPRSMRRVNESIHDNLKTDDDKRNKHKPKQKTVPLSKYRRKTANARERNRMREINEAFETLRRVIPQMQTPQVPGSNEKLTKITTLRLAMTYISSLSAALNNPKANVSNTSEQLSEYNDLDCLLLESDGESLPLSDHSLLASPDFPEPSLSPVDFNDGCLPVLLHMDFTEYSLESANFNDFLLT